MSKPIKRKYQVFVSSTYTDLIEERQAAVAAILKAGHIPAGMELFTAGNKSQMKVIERWIDESDIYMLILGVRYGSIEPVSGKSYTQLEFEYAVSKKKPFFAVVLSEEGLRTKSASLADPQERASGQRYNDFRTRVLEQMCSFFSDAKDIRPHVLESLASIIDDNELDGWVSARDAFAPAEVVDELARLTKENATLRKRLDAASQTGERLSNGTTVREMVAMLRSELVTFPKVMTPNKKDVTMPLADAFLANGAMLASGVDSGSANISSFRYLASPLAAHGLMEFGKVPTKALYRILVLSADGRKVLAQLKREDLVAARRTANSAED